VNAIEKEVLIGIVTRNPVNAYVDQVTQAWNVISVIMDIMEKKCVLFVIVTLVPLMEFVIKKMELVYVRKIFKVNDVTNAPQGFIIFRIAYVNIYIYDWISRILMWILNKSMRMWPRRIIEQQLQVFWKSATMWL
jgi:hypothetical protein